jgi:hypothetical protein
MSTKEVEKFLSTLTSQKTATPLQDIATFLELNNKKVKISIIELMEKDYIKSLPFVDLLVKFIKSLSPLIVADQLLNLCEMIKLQSLGPQIVIQVVANAFPDIFFLVLKEQDSSVAKRAFEKKSINKEFLVWVCLQQKIKVGNYRELHPKCLESII